MTSHYLVCLILAARSGQRLDVLVQQPLVTPAPEQVQRAQEFLVLDAVVRDACAGGPVTQRAAAQHLQVSQESFDTWCDLWRRALQGPQMCFIDLGTDYSRFCAATRPRLVSWTFRTLQFAAWSCCEVALKWTLGSVYLDLKYQL